MRDSSAETRGKVLSAAARLIEANGYASTTISDILRESGLSKGAMYHHFESKQAVAEALVDAQFDLDDIAEGSFSDPLEQAVSIIVSAASALESNPIFRAGVRLVVEDGSYGPASHGGAPYEKWVAVFEQLLSAAVENGTLDAVSMTARQAAEIFITSFTGLQLYLGSVGRRDGMSWYLSSVWSMIMIRMNAPGEVTAELARKIVVR